MICQNLGYLEPEQLKTAMVLNQDTGMLLTKLIKRVNCQVKCNVLEK
jgi:hypothetical protein